jgi:phosphohistidine phosphatase
MPNQLWILRHAKSAWDTQADTDFERPLAKRGIKDAPRMGKWMHEHKMIPDFIISSPAERARQTTLAICAKLGIKPKHIQWDERVYEAGVETLLSVLADCPKQAEKVLLVGHNPGLEELVEFLCEKMPRRTTSGKLLTTGALAQVELNNKWKNLTAGSASLVEIIRPKEI